MKNKEIVIQGARAHNLKNINMNIPRDKLVVMTGFRGPENRRLPLIRFTRKGNDDMSNHFRHMHGNF